MDIVTLWCKDVMMTEVLNVGEAKRRFSELIDRVGRGERIVVARRGRPVLALVPPPAAEVEAEPEVLGLAAFAGALAEWEDFEAVMDEVYASRRRARDRPAPHVG
jgi:prevent-host-death family protein